MADISDSGRDHGRIVRPIDRHRHDTLDSQGGRRAVDAPDGVLQHQALADVEELEGVRTDVAVVERPGQVVPVARVRGDRAGRDGEHAQQLFVAQRHGTGEARGVDQHPGHRGTDGLGRILVHDRQCPGGLQDGIGFGDGGAVRVGADHADHRGIVAVQRGDRHRLAGAVAHAVGGHDAEGIAAPGLVVQRANAQRDLAAAGVDGQQLGVGAGKAPGDRARAVVAARGLVQLGLVLCRGTRAARVDGGCVVVDQRGELGHSVHGRRVTQGPDVRQQARRTRRRQQHRVDAEGLELSLADGLRRLPGGGLRDDLDDDVGQGLQFARTVHLGGEGVVDRVAHQALAPRVVAAVGVVEAEHPELVAVVLRRQRQGVVVGTVGRLQDLVVGIDDALDFSPGVLQGRRKTGHRAVDGFDVGGLDARGAGIRVHLHVGHDVGKGVAVPALDDVERGRTHRCIDHALQFTQGVDAGAARGARGLADLGADVGQVDVPHAGGVHAQGFEVGLLQRAQAGLPGGGAEDDRRRLGQCLDLGHRVHVGRPLEVDRVPEQRLLDRLVHAGHRDLLVLRDRRLGGIVVGAVGGRQHRLVGVDDGLHLGDGVGPALGQQGNRAVDRAEVVGVDTVDAGVEVSLQRRHRVGAVVLADDLQRVGHALQGRVDDSLQLGQGIDLAAVVSAGGNGALGSGQVLRGQSRHAEQLELIERGLGTARSALDHGFGGTGQGVQLLARVDRTRELAVDHVAEQAQLAHRRVAQGIDTDAADPDSLVLLLAGVRRIVGRAVGRRQEGRVGIDDGLHLGGGVGALGRQEGDRGVDGSQVLGRHLTHARCGVGGKHRHRVRAVVLADDLQRVGGGLDGVVDHLL